VDPARARRTSSVLSDASAMSDEMAGAATCREAVDLVVERIQSACDDVGGGQGAFITEEDVVRYVVWRLWIPRVLIPVFFYLKKVLPRLSG
jgi:hypothetical protein